MSKAGEKLRAFAKRQSRNTEWFRRVGYRVLRAFKQRWFRTKQWFFRISYKWLWEYAEWRETWEIPLSLMETTFAAIGTVTFGVELWYVIFPNRDEAKGAEAPFLPPIVTGTFETVIFTLLMLSLLARLIFAIRERTLGEDFGKLVAKAASAKAKAKAQKKAEAEAGAQAGPVDEALFESLAQFAPAGGYLGAMIGAEADRRKLILDAIASESAMQFSRRTYGEVDPMWKKWEERYVGEWLERFPATVWCLPPDDKRGNPASGYYSVIVPATEDAFRKVGFGHLSTALCAIDESVIAYFHSPRHEPYGKPLYLVFYTLIHVPNGLLGNAPDQLKLLYGGVEHLAYLLKEFYPLLGETETASLRVICEASNKSLEDVLRAFGFAPVAPDFDLELERTHIRKSMAGFHLFEIAYDRGVPVIGEKKRAEYFLDLLRQIGRRDKAERIRLTENEPDLEITMLGRPRR